MVRLIPRLIKAAVSNLSKKPFTVEYPFKPAIAKENFRGVQRLDLDKCVGCGLCSIDCPSGAIEMVFYKEARRKVPVFHLDKCVFCYQCAESCRFNAISPTPFSNYLRVIRIPL